MNRHPRWRELWRLAAPALGLVVVWTGVGAAQIPNGVFSSDLSGFRMPPGRTEQLQNRNAALLQTGAIDPETYILGPGDLLGLEVLGAFSLSAEDRVAADGSVTFPQLGTFHVAGQTLAVAREQVLRQGRQLVRDGRMELVLRATRSFKVYIVGAVANPGAMEACPVTLVVVAVQLAGGIGDSSDVRNIEILHTDGTREAADLVPFLLAGADSGNMTLRDGDVIRVPFRTSRLTLEGAFLFPGVYDFRPGEGLGQVLKWAGLLPQADRSRAILQRFRDGASAWDTLSVDLRRVLDGSITVPLHADDRVLVRAVGDWRPGLSVTVQGAVNFPGPVPIHPRQTRLQEALRLAGGLREDALSGRIIITRAFAADSILVPDPIGEKRFVEALTRQSRRESMADLTVGDNPVLEAGDIVTVPRWGGWVEVAGQVKRPGLFDYVPEWRARDYIEAAGGFARNADKSKTRVALGNAGDIQFASDVEGLAPGDMVWVPEKVGQSFWSIVKDVVAVTASAAALVVVVRSATDNKCCTRRKPGRCRASSDFSGDIGSW